MIPTHLIQRLKKPYKSEENTLTLLGNSLAFGGGLVNGGLSPDAMKLLNPILRFDYMGSAEFEFGAGPQSLANIHEYCRKGLLKKSDAVYGEIKLVKPIYYLCRKEDEEQVIKVITLIAEKGDFGNKGIWLKECSNLKPELEMEQDDFSTVGWLELDNDFMFFIDKEMFNNIKTLFGLD